LKREKLTKDLIFGILIVRLVLESVKRVTALVHGVSQHVQLLEHSLVCDLPSHGLIKDHLCPEQDPAEAVVLHILCLQFGAFSDEEIYGSRDHLTKDCRKEHLHLVTLAGKNTVVEDKMHSVCNGANFSGC
jgi:hypothetical protein